MSIFERIKGGIRPIQLEQKALETKSGSMAEVSRQMENIGSAFEQFKEKHSRELAELKRGRSDPLTAEQVDKINKSISDIERTMEQEILGLKRSTILSRMADGGEYKSREAMDYEAAFAKYLRKGGNAAELDLERIGETVPELKALSVGSDPAGGFTVLPQIEQTMVELSLLISPIRQVASVTQIGNSALKIPVNMRGATAGWVGETTTRPETTASSFKEIEIPVNEIYCMPAATQSMLDDSFLNVEQWIANEAAMIFAQMEGQAFVSGTGLTKPRGFLTETVVADASWAWQKIGYYPSGASGAFDTTLTFNPIIDIIYGLRGIYRANAVWLANRRTIAAARKLKDSQGHYLWQPAVAAGQPATLGGHAVYDTEDMPDMAADSYSMLFGDMKQFYRIVDRIGIRTLRDPYTSKPYVLFYTTKRVGGAVQNFEAAKLLKFATS
jgi:HK97 family phage major capsid protein